MIEDIKPPLNVSPIIIQLIEIYFIIAEAFSHQKNIFPKFFLNKMISMTHFQRNAVNERTIWSAQDQRLPFSMQFYLVKLLLLRKNCYRFFQARLLVKMIIDSVT